MTMLSVLRRGLLVLALFALTGSWLPAWADTYQVGPGKPYATLQEVADRLLAGDIVEVDGNHTYPGDVVFDRPGSPASKITIRGIPIAGQLPVISGGTNTVHFRTSDWEGAPDDAGNHYLFEGFEITGGSSRCIYHQADDLTIREVVVHDCPAHGILGADQGSGSLLLEYSEIYACGQGTQRHQIYMSTDQGNRPGSVFRMQFCYLHDGNGGNNVKSRAERNEIYYNWIEGATYHELELIGSEEYATEVVREDSDVVGNVLLKRGTTFVVRFGGDGTGETFGRYRFVNNTVVVQPDASAVFRLFDGIESLEAHNNVFMAGGGGVVNLVRDVEVNWASGRQIAGSNNWVLMGSTNVPGEWAGTEAGADPGFVALAADDVRPDLGSPLIEKGTSTTSGPPGFPFPSPLSSPGFHPPLHELVALGSEAARPKVGTIDIGAFEWGVPSDVDASDGVDATGGDDGSGADGGVVVDADATPSGDTMADGEALADAASGDADGGASGTPVSGCGCRTTRGADDPWSVLFLGLIVLLALRVWR